MTRIRPYLPLVGFVLPTVVVGYGIVIPRSTIAGWNELTIGFATTILGAVLAYVAGVRMARLEAQGAVCTKPPLRVRIARWVNRQAAHPRGPFGRFLGWNWARETAVVNATTLDLLSLEPESHVLELGCGPGVALHEAARRASRGHLVGLDVSELMIATARRRNRSAIRQGRVELRQADADDCYRARATCVRSDLLGSLLLFLEGSRPHPRPARRRAPSGRPTRARLPSRGTERARTLPRRDSGREQSPRFQTGLTTPSPQAFAH